MEPVENPDLLQTSVFYKVALDLRLIAAISD